MQAKYLCVMIHIWIKVGLAFWDQFGLGWSLETGFSFPVKYFYWPFQGGTSFVDHLCLSVLYLLCPCARLFICALWSPAGKWLTAWLSFVVSNCNFSTFPLVSWVRCDTWLYRFLIFAPLLTLKTLFLHIENRKKFFKCYAEPRQHHNRCDCSKTNG